MKQATCAALAAATLAAGLTGGATTAVAATTSTHGATTAHAASTHPRTLHRGARGAAVRALQRALGLHADGVFGARTERAVKRFQRRHHLHADGVVGPQTRRALGLDARGASSRQAPAGGASAPDGGASAADAAPAPAAEGAPAAVAAARSVIGAPYARAGNGPDSFDCSGLTKWAFAKAGISLPRTSYDQYREGTRVALSSVQPGDLVFFDTAGDGASHVGIAASPTTAISATTHGVMEHAITSGYWREHYVGARRL
jgi:cell wall-associated NlpC family hydrolase